LVFNFLSEENQKALEEVLKVSFQDSDFEELQDQINAGNFKEIMEFILRINGINLRPTDTRKNVKEV
jgi:hypothetical protein